MLHEERMVRFQPEWSLGDAPCRLTGESPHEQARPPGRLEMAAAVVGNTLAGSLLLGLLLLLPVIIERLLEVS